LISPDADDDLTDSKQI